MDIRQESLKKHYEWNGKIEVISRVPILNSEELALAYTPGVAEPCLEIQRAAGVPGRVLCGVFGAGTVAVTG